MHSKGMKNGVLFPSPTAKRNGEDPFVSGVQTERPLRGGPPAALTLSRSMTCPAPPELINVSLTCRTGVDRMRGLIGGLAVMSLVLGTGVAVARDRFPATDPMPRPATVSAPTGLTTPPIGWAQLCDVSPEDCEVESLEPRSMPLTRTNWALVSRVNRDVNERIEQVEDIVHFGRIEVWTYPVDGKGDCEDLVLLKRRMLMEAGVPRQALLVTVVRDDEGAGHAVLTLRTDKGDFVLDNKTNRILDWRATGYAPVKRQSQENPNVWVSIGEAIGVTTTAGNPPH